MAEQAYVPINYDGVPPSNLKPGVYGETAKDQAMRRYLSPNTRRLYIMGQKTAAGSATAEAVNRIFSDAEAANLFGWGSELHEMAVAAIATAPHVQLMGVAVHIASGATAAHASATLALASGLSAVTTNVQGTIRIGDAYITWGVEAGQHPSQVVLDIIAAINAKRELPVTAAGSDETLVLTAKCAGALGNELSWSVDPGAEVVATAGTFSAGAGALDLDDALIAIRDTGDGLQPTHLAVSDNAAATLLLLRQHCLDMADPFAMRYAYGFAGFVGTLSEATARALTQNEWRMNLAAVEHSPSRSHKIAAAYAAAVASEEDPARPRQTLKCKRVMPPLSTADLWDGQEQQVLLENGVAPLELDAQGDMAIVREVTTYTTTSSGVPDRSGLDHTTVDTSDYVLADVVNHLRRTFPRSKKYPGIHADVRSAYLARMRLLYRVAQLVHDPESWANTVIVQDHPQDPGGIDIQADPILVVGLRQIRVKHRIVL